MNDNANAMKQRSSPAFQAMTLDILEQVLRDADSPGALGDYLTREMRELTGARTVILFQCHETIGKSGNRILCVNPERRRRLAESDAMKRLLKLIHELEGIRVWDYDRQTGEEEEILRDLQSALTITVPLNVGHVRVGSLLLLDLPEKDRVYPVVEALEMLSTIAALVFRNALLYEEQEAIIDERTKEIEEKHIQLQKELAERKKIELALRASEARYQDLYENAPDMFVSVDAESARILQCNQTLSTALGYSKEEIIGRPIFDMYHPDCMEEVKSAFGSFVETGFVDNAQLQLRRKDGSRIDVSLNVSAVRDETGKIIHSRSVWRDITERKEIEDEIHRLNEELEQRVAERTAELEKKTSDLGKFNRLFVDRELRMVELKKEIKKLREKS
jgi:PAS domain S-box-containing protein